MSMDNKKFRQAMGTFSTGITVITTENDGEVNGMTANAFMSVSLDPKLVLVSVDKKARILEKIKRTKRYGVSILSEDQKELSMNFAGQLKERMDPEFIRIGEMPVLENALVQLSCEVTDIHEAGDHVLFIGEVKELELKEGDPLLFYGGQYRQLKEHETKVL